MHYIIGTRILFTRSKIQPGISSSGIKLLKKPPEFEYDTTYSLYNIKKSDDKFIYSFQSNIGEIVQIEFNSISAGDQYIAKLKREIIPDYDSFHSRNTS